jgi:hypothetical protein
MQDLRWRTLAEIRKQPGCSDVQGIAINRVTDERAENNWSLCVLTFIPRPRIKPRSGTCLRSRDTTGAVAGRR